MKNGVQASPSPIQVRAEADQGAIQIVIDDQDSRRALRQMLYRPLTLRLSFGSTVPSAVLEQPPAAPRRLAVRRADGTVVYLRHDEIDWFEAANQYVNLHRSGQTDLIRASLRQLEVELDRERFLRIHRSAIVNLASVRGVQVLSQSRRLAVLRSGARLAVSPSLWPALEQALLCAP